MASLTRTSPRLFFCLLAALFVCAASARANDIDDPLALRRGTELAIPRLEA